MSMPGFVYHFHCSACGKNSDSYSMYVFPGLFESRLSLPAWSRELHCYGVVCCDLPAGSRRRLEGNHAELGALAANISSPLLTVGVPRWCEPKRDEPISIEVKPEPVCPFCGAAVETRFGYPPSE